MEKELVAKMNRIEQDLNTLQSQQPLAIVPPAAATPAPKAEPVKAAPATKAPAPAAKPATTPKK